MKKLIIRSMVRMLPLCMLLAFGLMSCQQEEEIIPLTSEDLIEEVVTEFDPETAEHVIIDKNGEIAECQFELD